MFYSLTFNLPKNLDLDAEFKAFGCSTSSIDMQGHAYLLNLWGIEFVYHTFLDFVPYDSSTVDHAKGFFGVNLNQGFLDSYAFMTVLHWSDAISARYGCECFIVYDVQTIACKNTANRLVVSNEFKLFAPLDFNRMYKQTKEIEWCDSILG